jgi:hypothetical protein
MARRRRHEQPGHDTQLLDRLMKGLAGQGHDRRRAAPVERDVTDDPTAILGHPRLKDVLGWGQKGTQKFPAIRRKVRRVSVEVLDDPGQLDAGFEVLIGPGTDNGGVGHRRI